MPVKSFISTLLLCAAAPTLITPTAFAQPQTHTTSNKLSLDAQAQTPTPGYWGYNFTLSSVGFESDAAQREGVKPSAWGIGMAGNYWWPLTVLSLGAEYYGYSDKASYSQQTVDNFGDRETSSSDASAFTLFAAYGPYWRLGATQTHIVYTQLGLNQVISSERSISYCSNCYSEDIELDAGLFAKVGYFHNFASYQLGIEAVQYLSSDDYNKTISLTWGIGF